MSTNSFSVIEVSTGRVLMSVNLSRGQAVPQPEPGQAVIPQWLDQWLQRVSSLEPITIVDATAEQRASREAGPPDGNFVWDIGSFSWVDQAPPGQRLFQAKIVRIANIKAEAVSRMPETFAALVQDAELFAVFRELWLSIAPAARSPTANLTQAINVYQAAASAIAQVRAATTVAEVIAVVVNWP